MRSPIPSRRATNWRARRTGAWASEMGGVPAEVGHLEHNTAKEDATVVAFMIGITVILGGIEIRLGVFALGRPPPARRDGTSIV
jgi:hypothetical protein